MWDWILHRLGKKKPAAYKLRTARDFQVQFRAFTGSSDFVNAMRRTCETLPSIRDCFLLDVKEMPGSEGVGVFVAISVDPPGDMDQAAVALLQTVFKFPEYVSKGWVVSTEGKEYHKLGRMIFKR